MGIFAGAGDESRTRDLNLGKVALYQLSYSRVWLPTWARTRDLRINSPALYRLSYRGIGGGLYNTSAAFMHSNNAVQCLRHEVRFEKDAGPEPSVKLPVDDIGACATGAESNCAHSHSVPAHTQ
jgi:hypothetical protein